MSQFLGAGGMPSEGPITPDTWKKALYMRPPNLFRVKLLLPEKQGNSHSYGFRIYSIKDHDTSTTMRMTSSVQSVAPADKYDVWRKWEDCLWFQESLEVAYSLAAREKRSRLAAGKGVKKNGIYIHSDQAASWESLPFGPDPDDIACDIHQYIPKLSKKATLFRASQETVDHRYQDLKMMLQALFQDDLPTLIKEMKATRTFTDFFGVWRRDIDLARNARSPQKPAFDRSRSSLSNSIPSALPVSPMLPSKVSSPTKGKSPEKAQILPATFTHSDSSSEDAVDLPRPSRLMDRRQEIRSMRCRASSTGSHSSSSAPSTPVTMPRQLPPTSRQPIVVSQEVPIRFGHNPHILGGERSSFTLESLPEDRELSSSLKPNLDEVWSRRRTESTSKMNRNARVYVPSPSRSLESSELPSRSLSRYSRVSLQSAHSSTTMRATAYLDELDMDYCLPSPTPEPRHHPRASVSSLASSVTNSSVDAVIPRGERPSRSSADGMQQSLFFTEEHLREYEPWSEDDSQSEDQGDILDAYFYDVIIPHPQTPTGYPETPTMDETAYRFSREQSSATVSSFSRYSDRRSSWTTSISSGSTSSSGNSTMISIKAMHEDDIVMLRLPRCITFDELRRKIYDKFIQTDKSTICDSFAMALVKQTPAGKIENRRPRADSLSSLGSARAKGAALHFISSQDEWDNIAATHCGKILLRIIGSRE